MLRKNINPAGKTIFILFLFTGLMWPQITFTENFVRALKKNNITADEITGRYLQKNFKSIPPRLYDEIPFQFGSISNTADLEFRVRIMSDDGQAVELKLDRTARAISSGNYILQPLGGNTLKYYNADTGFLVELDSVRPNFSADYKMCRLFLLKDDTYGYITLIFLMNSLNPSVKTEISKLKYWLYFNKDLEPEYAGLGIRIKFDSNNDYIIDSVMKGYGADKAGLLPRDVITQIEGEEVRGMSSQQVVNKLKGLPGTSVGLMIRRDSKAFQVHVVREKIRFNTDVTWIDSDELSGVIEDEPLLSKAELCNFLDGILTSEQDDNRLKGKYLGRDFMGVESWQAKAIFPGAINGKYIRSVSFTESKYLEYTLAEDIPFDKATKLYDEILQQIYSCIGGMYIKGETTTGNNNERTTYFEHALRGDGGSADKMPVLKVYRTGSYTVGINILLM
ncbi:MAG: PDZ domain-containing protein [FCB group bacterium]|nr:PDZ domain-containing protein [FCB group bacterium]